MALSPTRTTVQYASREDNSENEYIILMKGKAIIENRDSDS